MTTTPRHAFVVPAYGNSPHLRECLTSLKNQSWTSAIAVSTSTPSIELEALCESMGIELRCHSPNKGIAHDWNKALESSDAEWVTIAHQDDVYLPEFAARTLRMVERRPESILVFTGYREIGANGIRPLAAPLLIKRVLIELALLGRPCVSSKWARTNLLRLGCPIPCPSVTLRKSALLPGFGFDRRFKVNLDWDFWLRLARETEGGFSCDRGVLMHHRIHTGSETTSGIAGGIRQCEDRELFGRVWPAPLAALIARAYALSYPYNDA